MSRRITITVDGDDMSDDLALLLVSEVVRGGRVSDNGRQYCYVTTFKGGTVIAGRTKTGNDSFKVIAGTRYARGYSVGADGELHGGRP